MKKILILFTTLIFLILVAAATAAVPRYQQLKRGYAARVAQYRTDYAAGLESVLNAEVSPEHAADVHARVSGQLFNEVLGMAVGQKFAISKEADLMLSSLALRVEDGTPVLALTGKVTFASLPSQGLEIKGLATLAPPVVRNDKFVTRLQVVALEPDLTWGTWRLAFRGFFGDLATTISQEFLEKAPEIELPVSQAFKMAVQGTTTALTFPTRTPGDTISGNLTTPSFELKSGLAMKQWLFLGDGLHLFLQVQGPKQAAVAEEADKSWAGLNKAERLKSLEFGPASYAVRVKTAALNQLSQQLLAVPPAGRTVAFQSTAQTGNFWDYYHPNTLGFVTVSVTKANAHLDHPDSLHGAVELRGVSLAPVAGAFTGITLDASLSAHAQIKAWSNGGIPGFDGGAGSSIGTDVGATPVKLKGRIIATDAGGSSRLSAILDGPGGMAIRVRLSIRPFNPEININVPLPVGRELFSASFPTGLEKEVSFRVQDATISRAIRLADTKMAFATSSLLITGNASLVQTGTGK